MIGIHEPLLGMVVRFLRIHFETNSVEHPQSDMAITALLLLQYSYHMRT